MASRQQLVFLAVADADGDLEDGVLLAADPPVVGGDTDLRRPREPAGGEHEEVTVVDGVEGVSHLVTRGEARLDLCHPRHIDRGSRAGWGGSLRGPRGLG